MEQHTTPPGDALRRAAQALVDESAIEMTTEAGGIVEVWTISSGGDTVRASAPRLLVRTGMRLSCRVMIGDAPHHVTAVIAEATVSSGSRAALLLKVIESSAAGLQRRSERAELHVPAVVTAIVCHGIPADQPLSAVITDVSEGGIALSVADSRTRENDRLRLQVRVFEGMIDCELRVKSVRRGDKPGNQLAGCAFLACSDTTAEIIRCWIDRVASAAAPAGPLNVRESLGIRAADAPEPSRSDASPARLRPAWQV